MDYSKLTKEQVIDGIKDKGLYLCNLPEHLRDDKDVLLEAMKKEWNFWLISEKKS